MNERQQPSNRRAQWAWYMYDFGNSAYAAVVLLAVYSAYFQGAVVGGPEGTRLWGRSVGIAMLTVAVIAPVLGAIADFSGAKKRFLAAFTGIAIVCTALLATVGAGEVVAGMAFFIVAEIGYRGAQVFYNALLPDVAEPREMARVSGNGWAVGSLGGIICLLIVLLPALLGGEVNVSGAMLFTAGYFLVGTLPLFLIVKEKARPKVMPQGENILSVAFKQLGRTFRSVKTFREYMKFLAAFLIYNDGILMALNFAAILGAVLYGLEQEQLIIFMIIVQVTNVAGAWVSGHMAARFGGKPSLFASLLLMVIAAFWLYVNTGVTGFYLIGALAGVAMAGVQSVSRTMVGLLAPQGQSAEFYGIFAIAGRTSSFIGPWIFGVVAAEVALRLQAGGMNATLAEQQGLRLAVLTIIAFIVVGMAVLATVNERAGQQMAAQVEHASVGAD